MSHFVLSLLFIFLNTKIVATILKPFKWVNNSITLSLIADSASLSFNEKTDDLCLATISEHLELAITEVDIKHTHRIGKPRDVGQKSRPIIVKFVRYNDRKNVFNRKEKLKGKNISITESLTVTRMKKLNEGREIYEFKNVWTSDGKFLFKDGSGNINLFYD